MGKLVQPASHKQASTWNACQGERRKGEKRGGGGGVGGRGRLCLAASSDVSKTAVKRLEHGKHTRSQKREEVTPVEFWKQTLPRKLNLKQNREKVEKQFKFYIEPS